MGNDVATRPAILDVFLARAAERVPVGAWGLSRPGYDELRALVSTLSPRERVDLLRAAVAQLPRVRASGEGDLLYATVGVLYSARLRLTEDDLCQLLLAARHDCGHGLDTRPPFDLARTYLRKHGYSPAIGAAIAAFVDNLPKSSAIQVKELRRSAALLALLGPEPPGRKGTWVRALHRELASVDGPERAVWENLIVAMSASERMVMPNTWRAPAEAAVKELGADLLLGRLRAWWPEPDDEGVINLQDGGAQVLKHFIWMLSLLPRAAGEPLVACIADVRFKGRDEPMAVLKPAAAYLEESATPEAQQARKRLLARID